MAQFEKLSFSSKAFIELKVTTDFFNKCSLWKWFFSYFLLLFIGIIIIVTIVIIIIIIIIIILMRMGKVFSKSQKNVNLRAAISLRKLQVYLLFFLIKPILKVTFLLVSSEIRWRVMHVEYNTYINTCCMFWYAANNVNVITGNP